MAGETPQQAAKVVIDPEHPEAGKGGVVPPVEHRFGPGNLANPGGRPKGYDPRAVMRRRMAENQNEHGEGAMAVEIADRIIDLATEIAGSRVDRDTADTVLKALDAQLKIIHEVSGKPQEFVEHTGAQSRTLVIHGERPNVPPPELPA